MVVAVVDDVYTFIVCANPDVSASVIHDRGDEIVFQFVLSCEADATSAVCVVAVYAGGMGCIEPKACECVYVHTVHQSWKEVDFRFFPYGS